MKKSIIIAFALSIMPVFAQEAPQCPQQNAPQCQCPCPGKMHGPRPDMKAKFMEKFDANKDGQLDEQEKAAAKAEFEAKHAEMKAKFMEKFDANKDGQIDEQEKEAFKAQFEAKRGERGPKGPKPPCGHRGHGPKAPCGHRGHGPKPGMHKAMMEKFDANKDGQLDEQEKEAMKAQFEARKAEMKAKFMEKFDANKDGQIDEQEKQAIKAEFDAKRGERCGKKGPRGHRGHGHGPKAPMGGCPCKKA